MRDLFVALQGGMTRLDGLLVALSALIILYFAGWMYLQPHGSQAAVFLDNQWVRQISLAEDSVTELHGHLGLVNIEVLGGRVRILEYESPRMIGTRTGWIQSSGAVTACIPCGILIRIDGEMAPTAHTERWDGIAR